MAQRWIGKKPLSEPMLIRYAALGGDELTHSGPLTPYDKRELGQHWFRYWLVAGIHFWVMFT